MSGDWDRSEPVRERVVVSLAAALAATIPLAIGLSWIGVLALSTVVRAPNVEVPVLAAIALAAGLGSFLVLFGPLRSYAVRAAEVAWLVLVPLAGLALDLETDATCAPCSTDPGRPVAVPGVWLVYAVYGLALAAWVANRVRPEPLERIAEVAVQAGLLLGVVVCSALTLQFGGWIVVGAIFAPIGLPLVAPPVAALCFGVAALLRARRAPPELFAGVLAAASALGADALLHRALTGDFGLWAGAFARTCGWTFSTLKPDMSNCGDDHYLCTVAARGHPWLVRPLRTGRRRGQPIVVNRQLAVANAFEDLLHERWPRFGWWARRTYDRVGLPVSRWIRHPLAADAVFLVMLPAQWVFEVTLRSLDSDPEARIDRMYR